MASNPAEYEQTIERFTVAVGEVVPQGSTVVVVSKGDTRLLELAGRRGWHFPQREDGAYAGHYPADGDAAIHHLEALRQSGGEFLAFPQSSYWWLSHHKYSAFREHLDEHYSSISGTSDAAIIFDLRRPRKALATQAGERHDMPEMTPAEAVKRVLASGIFNAKYYEEQAQRRFGSPEEAVVHYLEEGWRLNLNPHPLFDTQFYRDTYGEADGGEQNPLVHYVCRGYKEARDPHPLFDTDFFLSQDVRMRNAEMNPLSHYISLREAWAQSPNPLFDSSGYMGEVEADGVPLSCAPLEHYVRHGWSEGRYPSTHVRSLLEKAYSYVSQSDGEVSQSRRRIWVALHDASRTGAPLIGLNIAKHLVHDHGCDCTIILGRGGPIVEELTQYGAVLNLDDLLPVTERASGIRMLLYAAKFRQPMFGICNSVETRGIMDGFYKLGIPFISLIHEFLDDYSEKVVRRIHSQSQKVIFPAGIVQEVYAQKIGEAADKMAIIPQGVSEVSSPRVDRRAAHRELRDELRLDKDVFVCLGTGYVDLRKGCDQFVAIAKAFFSKYPNSHAVFVWVGDLGSTYATSNFQFWLMQDIQMAGLQEKVHFIGSRAPDLMNRYFVGSDAFLMVSRHDPFPSVVLEAMAARLPIVCYESRIGSVEVLKQGVGFTVPFLDVGAAADQLHRLYSDRSLREQVGGRARKVVRKQFQFSDYVAKLLQFIPVSDR